VRAYLPFFKLASKPSKLEYISLLTRLTVEGFLHRCKFCSNKIERARTKRNKTKLHVSNSIPFSIKEREREKEKKWKLTSFHHIMCERSLSSRTLLDALDFLLFLAVPFGFLKQ